jgi:hypothetical protein
VGGFLYSKMLKYAKLCYKKIRIMNVRDIVRKAWQLTQVHLKKLIWYGAVPSFFTITLSSLYIGYQYNAFKNSALFTPGEDPSFISDIGALWDIVVNHPKFSVILITLGIIIVVGYILLPPIFRGTLIQALMKIRNYEPIKGSFELGVRRFFPMFEFSVITGSFSILTLFSESSFILRWWGESMFFLALPILLFIAMIGLIANFLFTYVEYFIVLEDKRIIKAIGESVILVVSNLRKTILVLILMLLIGARIILNVLLVLFIPMGIIVATSYFATIFLNTIGIAILIFFVLAVLLVASYLMGLFNIFATAVWVLTFAVLAEKGQQPIKDVDLGGGNLKLEPVVEKIPPPNSF